MAVEFARWGLLIAIALWLARPFMTSRLIGSGDAWWYANMLRDFLVQLRHGIFPVWIGQTEFAFNGAVYPLRAAPYYQYLGGLLDLLTLHRLDAFSLHHATVVVSLVAAVVITYWSLCRLAPSRRNLAAVLTVLYVTCPAVLGLATSMGLYMSVMAIPFLPLVTCGLAFSLRDGGWKAQRMIVVGLALTWYAHAPLAAWLTLITVGVQAIRLLLRWRSRQVWQETFGGALLLAGLVAAVFASVASLRGGDTASIIPYAIDRAKIIAALREAFPYCLLPVRMPAVNLGDLQLGYALWAVLLTGGVFALTPGHRRHLLLAIPAALLVVMLLPMPGLTVWLWNAIPESLARLTFYWPMHRLCPVLAALALPLGMLALSAWLPRWEVASNKHQVSRVPPLSPPVLRSLGEGGSLSPSLTHLAEGAAPEFQRSDGGLVSPKSQDEGGALPHSLTPSLLLSLSLLVALIWATWQADKLVATVTVRTASWHDTVLKRQPENTPLMNHAYGLSLALPPYFSNGVMDPWFELRVLAGGQDVEDNTTALLAGNVAPWAESATLPDPNPGIWDLSLSPTLKPGRRHLLEFDFGGESYRGILQIEGEHFFRQYRLPASGQTQAFGSEPSLPHWIPLWTTSDRSEKVRVRFIPDPDTATSRPAVFARFRWHTIDPPSLPLRIDSYAPLRLTVTLEKPGLLETFRMYFPGYRAKVDGRPVPVIPSPSRMASVSLPAGMHDVEIDYRPSWRLRMALGVSAATWLALLASALFRRVVP